MISSFSYLCSILVLIAFFIFSFAPSFSVKSNYYYDLLIIPDLRSFMGITYSKKYVKIGFENIVWYVFSCVVLLETWCCASNDGLHACEAKLSWYVSTSTYYSGTYSLSPIPQYLLPQSGFTIPSLFGSSTLKAYSLYALHKQKLSRENQTDIYIYI
jgi:hypothetical protein